SSPSGDARERQGCSRRLVRLQKGDGMNGPKRYLARMFVFLAAVAAVVAVLFGPLYEAFMANPGLNGLILGVLLLGIVYIIRQVFQLAGEESWIQNFRTGQPGISVQEAPKLLAPMAAMLGDRK